MSETESGSCAFAAVVTYVLVKNEYVAIKYMFNFTPVFGECEEKTAFIHKGKYLYEQALKLKPNDLVYATANGENEIVSIEPCDMALVKSCLVTPMKIYLRYTFADEKLNADVPEEIEISRNTFLYDKAKNLVIDDVVWVCRKSKKTLSAVYHGSVALVSDSFIKNDKIHINFYAILIIKNMKFYKECEIILDKDNNLYQSALYTKKGDLLWVIPNNQPLVIRIDHYNFIRRFLNKLCF